MAQRIALATITILALLPGLAGAWTVERSFDVASHGQLSLDTDVGSIDLRTHASDSVEVKIDVSGLDEDEVRLDFDHRGDDVTVSLDARKNYGQRNRVEFTIFVPQAYNVDLETSGGSIAVRALEGLVRVNTAGGSLDIADITGDVKGKTSGGPIDVEHVQGQVDISTSGGRINVSDVSGGVRANTSGGSISIKDVRSDVVAVTSGGSIEVLRATAGVQARTSGGSVTATFDVTPAADVSLKTSGGSIVVELPSETMMTVSARARRIYSELPVDGVTSAEHRLRGDINDGGPALDLHTSSGTIRINQI